MCFRVDDILALLLAFSAVPEELEITLISLCFGNVDVERFVSSKVFMKASYRLLTGGLQQLPTECGLHVLRHRPRAPMAYRERITARVYNP